MISRILAASLAAFSGAVCAQGYFDFSEVPGLGEDPHVQIDLNPAMLGFVTAGVRETDPQAAEAIAGIENIRVRVYEDVEDPQAVLEFVEDSSGRLESEGWQRVVYVQEENERVRVYMKFEENRAVGLTVMVIDGGSGGRDGGGEAVFINVAGDIDPTKLGQVASAIGMRGMLDGVVAPAPAPAPATPDGGQ